MKVILDTNALMVPEQFGVDIFSELQRLGYVDYMVPKQVLAELETLKTKGDKGLDKIAARVGLGLAERCKIIDDVSGSADQAIEHLSVRENAAVFTNDKALKKRLFNKGITVVYLRQGRYLEVTLRSSDV
ncbi:MAG: PIN domain-containing protein [Methanotrichaceae archaeon]